VKKYIEGRNIIEENSELNDLQKKEKLAKEKENKLKQASMRVIDTSF